MTSAIVMFDFAVSWYLDIFIWVSGLDFSINKICIKLENVK